MSEISLADAMALKNGNNDGMNSIWNNPFIYFVWIALFWGGGFGGFGNDKALNNCATAGEVRQINDTQTILSSLNGIGNGICDAAYAINNSVKDSVNYLGRDLINGFNNVGSAVNNLSYQQSQCCCETNRNIDSVRYENAQNTCAITTAIHNEGCQTRELINALELQHVRDDNAQLRTDLAVAQGVIQNNAQAATLVNTLRPFPQPAYITCSPYTSSTCGCNL